MDAAFTLKSSPKNEIFLSILYRSAFEIMQLEKKTKLQKKKTNKIAESESKNKSQYGTENFHIVIVRLHTNK